MSEPQNPGYTFADFRIDTLSRQLRRGDGTPIALTPKVFDTLLLLVENGGNVISKDALMAAIWPNRIVEENNLTQNISTLRRVLGASAGDHRFILTEPGLGYRFVEPVQIVAGSGDAPSIRASTSASSMNEQRVEAVPAATGLTHALPMPRRVGMIAAGLIVLAIVATAGWFWSTRTVIPRPVPSLAILPFKPLLADSQDDVLQIGLADTLITKLSTNPHVVVRSLDTVRRLAGSGQDAIAMGRTLGVDSVLEGYIQREGDRVRVNARLLAIPGGAALWAGTFDTRRGDVFVVQDTIAQKVAAALSLRLDLDERLRMQKNYTNNLAAYQWYLQGRIQLKSSTPAGLDHSIDAFQEALKVDPNYALAYVGLAEAYRRQTIISDADPQVVLPLARTAATHALKIDDTLAEAYVPLGFVHFWYDRDWAASEAAFKRGIELQPNFADLHFGYAALLSNLGRDDEALRESQRARELDPTSPLYAALEASFIAYAGHTDEARQQVEGVLRLHPDFWIAHLTLGWLDTNAGHYADAVSDFTRASKFSGGSQQAVSMLGFALARAGRKQEAQALLDSLLLRSRQQYLPPTSIATIYCGLGDHDQALSWLERGYAAHDVRMTFLKVDHRWDALRGDPRFAAIVHKLRLP
ncbi:MAG: tetratricopeptide repeat protein [Rhodanobacter sp.]